jgi:hypothetical protein
VKTEWVLSQEAFDRCLAWLDPDRERAGEKYEEIRRKLISDFVRREWVDPEGLADETIDRVIHDLPEIAGTYVGDPALSFYAMAQRLARRFWRSGSEARLLPRANEPKRRCGVKSALRDARSIFVLKAAS